MPPPYKNREELPERVKGTLPSHAQEIWMKAANSAWDQYKSPEERRGGRDREETAYSVAWSAVEKEYTKDEKSGEWERRE